MTGKDEYLTTRQLAEETGTNEYTWHKRRVRGDGPKFLKLGKTVRYRRSDVEAWFNSRMRRSTSDPGAPAAV
jgi:predicted DNA-binding transcriptional regulator AlpA